MSQKTSISELNRQRMLLQAEYEAEKEAFRKQTEAQGMARKVKRGDAWYPLRAGRSYYNSLNQLVIEMHRMADEDVEHNFECARPVVFFTVEGTAGGALNRAGSKLRYFGFTAVVSYVDGNRMVLVLPDMAQVSMLAGVENLGLQLSFDETSYHAMFDALNRVASARDNRLAYLRDLFYSGMPARRFHLDPIPFPWLNLTQEKAVNEVLRAKDVMVVHGPPGTGKTTTLVEAIYETLRRESQVMVCAQSNMAVDWISEKLVDRGVNVLRIGNPTRVNDKMLSFTYERRFEAHPDYHELWSLRKAIRELRGRRRGGTDGLHQKLDRLKSRATELELRINNDLFGEARVVASTLVGSANRVLDGRKYASLFIDEAAQALEAACWIPIRKVSRVILAGDHCQLPPTIKSMEALKGGLGKTLMERIVENKPDVVTLLQMQYRMHKHIMRFSSDYFYGGKVESAPQIKFRGILDYDIPIEWIPRPLTASGEASDDYKEQFVGENYGRINKAEAALTLDTLERYLTKIGKERVIGESIDVGIISPYRAQVQYLRRLITKNSFFKPFRKLITVNTVDGFQGQERDVIIISMVRSNDEGDIGFLRDLRRMNVAMTRARMKLMILGDNETLSKHPFYRRLYNYVQTLKDEAAEEKDTP